MLGNFHWKSSTTGRNIIFIEYAIKKISYTFHVN